MTASIWNRIPLRRYNRAMTASLPHILVVDDDTRLRELLRRFLTDNGFLVSTATDAADARAKLEGLAFDLIVLDVMMPGESGLELTAALRKVDQAPILLLTAMGETENRIDGLERGAEDYLVKPFEPRELVLRIRTILRRRPVPTPVLASSGEVRFGSLVFDIDREQLHDGGEPVHLTSAESSLLRVLAMHPGDTLSRERLSELSRFRGSTRTVDVQVTRLRRKIEPEPKFPRYLQTVWGRGYVLHPD
jgi:two-component system phosphate regulon response regulator OmpR